MFGAENESKHVFIEAGYLAANGNSLSVLEIGFGTGLNAWLTLKQAVVMRRSTYYEAVELYPVDCAVAGELSDDVVFRAMHAAVWDEPVEMAPGFVLHKRNVDLLQSTFAGSFDVVYFDAFSPAVQPEMWSVEVFSNIYASMNPDAILTTYCAKGDVRRRMQSVGFHVERLPGPTGKREILRARKLKYHK